MSVQCPFCGKRVSVLLPAVSHPKAQASKIRASAFARAKKRIEADGCTQCVRKRAKPVDGIERGG